jgi:hypothetical protein
MPRIHATRDVLVELAFAVGEAVSAMAVSAVILGLVLLLWTTA